MLEILKTNNAGAFFLSTISGLILFLPLLFLSQEPVHQQVQHRLLLNIATTLPVWVQYVITITSYLIAAWYANYMVTKHQLLGRGNQLIGFFIAILLAIGPNLLLENLLGISVILIIRLFDRCFEIQKSIRPNQLLFDATFITAILTLFYLPFLLLLIVVWMAAIYSGHFSFKGALLTLFTLIITLYIFTGVLYLFNIPFDTSIPPIHFQFEFPSTNITSAAFYLLIALIVLAIPTTFSVLRFSKVIVRNHINLSLRSIPIFFVIFLTASINSLAIFSFLFFPLAIILALLFLKVKKVKLANIGIILIALLTFTFQIFRIL